MKFKRVSADEAMSKRKDHLRDTDRGQAVVKAAKAPASWDKASRSARFIMTTEQVDRYGDIVVTSGGDTEEFERNPVGLLFHNSRTWPVARWENLEKQLRGRPPRMEGDFVLLPSGGPIKEIDETAWMIEQGGIRACSIGFIPDWNEVEMILDDEGKPTWGFRFNAWEMVECSVCAVPANPGALAKSADGDMRLALELVEDVLDNFARSPAGLLIPRSEFEAQYRAVTGERSTFIVDKSLDRPAVKFAPLADMRLSATSDEEAATFVGAKVMFDPSNGENKGWPYDVLDKATGEVVASYLVPDGEMQGVHALWVEFLTDDYNGMFRGIRADRFLLADKDAGEPEVDAEPEESAEKPDPSKSAPDPIVVSLKVDTADAEAEISRISGLLDGISKRIAGLFGRSKEDDRVEPKFDAPAPPAPEVIDATKVRASAVLSRLRDAGKI